jgi:hypothetical protein
MGIETTLGPQGARGVVVPRTTRETLALQGYRDYLSKAEHTTHSQVQSSIVGASQVASNGSPELHPEDRLQGDNRAN